MSGLGNKMEVMIFSVKPKPIAKQKMKVNTKSSYLFVYWNPGSYWADNSYYLIIIPSAAVNKSLSVRLTSLRSLSH
jgi:hypothetical protein